MKLFVSFLSIITTIACSSANIDDSGDPNKRETVNFYDALVRSLDKNKIKHENNNDTDIFKVEYYNGINATRAINGLYFSSSDFINKIEINSIPKYFLDEVFIVQTKNNSDCDSRFRYKINDTIKTSPAFAKCVIIIFICDKCQALILSSKKNKLIEVKRGHKVIL